MQKSANRILSMLLAVVMIMAMLPATVFAASEADVLEGWNIALGDNIGINFRLNSDSYTVDTTVNGVAVTPAVSGNVVTVNVAAAQMTDTVGLTVRDGENEVHSGSYSVRQYAETILSGDYADEVKQMVKEMLNYGAAAQTNFDYNTGSLANAGYELETAATVPTEVPVVAAEDNLDGIDLYGMSLVFRSKTAVRFYFTVSGNIADYTFKVDEKAYEPVEKDGMYYVEVSDINPQELSQEFTVYVNGGDLMATYSPLTYIVRKYNSASSSAELKALVQAMYGYHKEALAYVRFQASEAVRPTEGNVAALNIHYIRDSAPMSFITKNAYPAGTTITFKAYQPYIADSGNRWWGVGTTTDATTGDIYACSKTGNNMYSADNDNYWAEFSYTIPADSEDSYIYIAGAKNIAWINDLLLIDDVVITTPDGESVTDGFEYGLTAGLFNFNAASGNDQKAVTLLDLSPVTEPTGNVAALTINKLNEGNPMSFITKEAYAGGSTVGFEAFVPTGATWWAVCWTTDPADVSLYKWTSGLGQDMTSASVKDAWAQYYVTLPDDGNSYYIYFVGEKNKWKDAEGNDLQLLIDNVTIAKGSTVATDDFEGVSLFNFNNGAALLDTDPVTVQEALDNLKAHYGNAITLGTELVSAWTVDGDEFAVQWTATGAASVANGKLAAIAQNEAADYTLTVTVSKDGDTASYTWNGTVDARTGNVAAITVNKLNEKTPMSFITKEAYAGGSTISFEAFVPADVSSSWWSVCWTMDTSSTSIYAHTKNLGTDMKSASVYGAWAEYSVTLPDDGNSYYIYFVGEKGQWKDAEGNDLQLLIDNVTITSGSTVATDDFEGDSLFDFNAGAALLAVNAATAEEALADLKASYGASVANGTELVTTWKVGGKNFTVQWTVDAGASAASIENNKLVLTPQGTTVNYLLTVTVSDGEDTASYSWIGNVAPQANTVAAITIGKLSNDNKIRFITNDAYIGGSTISFEAYVPTGASWWKVAYTTDPVNDVSIYKGTDMTSVKDAWSEYSLTLPNDGNSYYIYLTGPAGEWKDSEGNMLNLLVDNVVITAPDGTSANDDFEGDSLFTLSNIAALQTIEPEEVTPRAGNYVAIYPDYLTEEAPMSFITKQAYAGGNTVSFEAYVPSDTSWWAVCWTTDPKDVSLYKWTSGLGQDMTSASVKDAWAEYSVTLPNDGNSYYVYIVGAKGEWNDSALLIDNVTIGSVTEDFENGLDDSIFSYIGRSSGGESIVELQTYNYAQQLQVAKLATGVDFISKVTFPAGSTVTFDAKVPETHDWWAMNWTTDPGLVNNESARYLHTTSGISLKSFEGKWSNYTVTLPADGGPYHLFIVGPNEWGTNTLLIDNFKVTDAEGNVLADENFNHAIADSIFVANTAAASMYEVASYTDSADAEIQFTAYAAPTVNRSIPADNKGAIGAAYRRMAEAGFNKAIALHEGSNGTFDATTADGVKTEIAEHSAVTETVAQIVMEKAGRYGISYYAKDWGLYNLGGTYTDDYGVDSSIGLTQEDFNEIISTMLDSDNPYNGNAGYAGHFGYDEPFYADLEKVGWAAKAYKESGVSGELFVNLLPTYVNKNSPQLGAESYWDKVFGDHTYENYLTEYLERTEGYLDYICWDYYPFMNATDAAGKDISSQQATRIQKYLAGYEVMANAAKENGRELRIIIQSSGDSVGNKDLEGKSELSFQIYSGLAFGVKEFIYYMYSGSSTSGYDYIFNYDNQTYNDTVYGWAQDVNNAAHAFEEVYEEYTWNNVMKVDADSSSVMMNNLTGAVTSSDKLKVEGSGDYLVGMFTAKDSASNRQNAFMLVNAEYNPGAAAHDVVLTIPDASAVSVCRNGEQTVIKLNDTQCILESVQPGEGIFLVPLY